MNVAERIKQARESAGLTQTELGERCGIHRRDIGKYETGATRNIPLSSLEKIAGALNRPMAWFFLDEDAADTPGPLAALVDDVTRDPAGPLSPRQVQAQVQISDQMMPGVVSLPHGWGHHLPGTRLALAAQRPGANLNALLDDQLRDPLSGNAVLGGVAITLRP